MMKEKLELEIEGGEAWWGGASMHGPSMPITKASDYFLDNKVNSTYNQVNGLFTSTHGRYIHVDGDFTFSAKNGTITVQAENKPEYASGFSTLRGAYLAAYSKFCTRKNPVRKDLLIKPQYCTWMECLKEPSQEAILRYAQSILDAGLPAGLLIIDDGWCNDYGDWRFVKERFPDPKAMISKLHEMGFAVSIWVCPFVNEVAADFARLKQENALVRDANGEVAIREWWNGHSAVLDLTSLKAVEYFKEVLNSLTKLGADGFKFDAGDAFYYEHSDITCAPTTPNGQSYLYAKLAAEYAISELRACVGMGGEPVIQRLSDKKSEWEGDGLSALVPDMLQASMNGYVYCCADMVGGGQGNPNNRLKYDEQEEFLLRSIQCVAMMPCMQFSYALWRGASSQEVREEVKRSVDLHTSLKDYITETIKKSETTGEPIMRPLEYDFPGEGYAEVKDCFMLGEKYLVAPVTKPNQSTLTLRLPSGYQWKYADGKVYRGGEEVEVPADIKTLPYFERISY